MKKKTGRAMKRRRLSSLLWIARGLSLLGEPIHSFTSIGATNRNIFDKYTKGHRIRAASSRQLHEDELYNNHTSSAAQCDIQPPPWSNYISRRSSLHGMLALATAATTTASLLLPQAATAGIAEMDKYGNLFTPKSDMLRGGSEAARGIATRQRGKLLQPGQALQSVYETRFIAYLSRFLLNFDPAANAWALQNGLRYTWEDTPANNNQVAVMDPNLAFAEFAESVEVGLADYFVGPYGSYSSVQAAKAGILASASARSSQPRNPNQGLLDLWQGLLSLGRPNQNNNILKDIAKKTITTASTGSPAQQGVLNLYSLLKARYTSVAAKRQLAILFSLISTPTLQPTQEIRGLLGEADNATISQVTVVRQLVTNEEKSRTSSRRGGGYSIDAFPAVIIETPPALGDDYRPAILKPIMKPTSRVLRIRVTDHGEGYQSAPVVTVQQIGANRPCQACAILDRNGRVAEVLVLDPGYGFGGLNKRHDTPPKVRITPPRDKKGRTAKAVADLEYELVNVQLVQGGNGYSKTQAPNVVITPPEVDPDWFLATQEQPELRTIPVRDSDIEPLTVEVKEMQNPEGNVVYKSGSGKRQFTVITKALVQRLRRDPLELLPSSVLLETAGPVYKVASLPPIPSNTKLPSPRYRAFDPIFGGVGSVPVTKGALALSASEYARLALSGAVCTVVVRTALNPLELIKTKTMLQSDKELFDYARHRMTRKTVHSPDEGQLVVKTTKVHNATGTSLATEQETVTATKTMVAAEPEAAIKVDQPKLGIADLIFSLAELRGPLALFQSADITFLASLVFGSFGFGATELFRRSFTEIFFSDANGSSGSGGSEIVLLLAAGLATVVTSAAATPFEVLRVKSMIRLDAVGWTDVLRTYLKENDAESARKGLNGGASAVNREGVALADINPRDLLPLWAGFAPTLSRELPFAIAKFLVFDLLARFAIDFINSQTQEGALPVQVGVGPAGLAVSAIAGAIAGVAGAIVSHPADLILTYTSASRSQEPQKDTDASVEPSTAPPGWVALVRELLSRDGGIANLFLGLPARAIFFFLVIGLQFFLYDYVKNLFEVGTDDLSLVLDVFYAVRAGLVDMD